MSPELLRTQCQKCGDETRVDSRREGVKIQEEPPCGHEGRIWIVWGDAVNPVTRELERHCEAALDTYGVDIVEKPVWSVLDREEAFEVSVGIDGELLLEEVMAEQGRLLYCKNGVDVQLRGQRNGNLLLRVASL
jgi:hypothetical protein